MVVPQFNTTLISWREFSWTANTVHIHPLLQLQPLHLMLFSSQFSALTSITIISLVLWRWTLGCWTLTATVLPSCNTALWTWAKEAAPRGLSSNATNNSDSCNTQRKQDWSSWTVQEGQGHVIRRHFHNKTFRVNTTFVVLLCSGCNKSMKR